ncbi:Protein kinase domain-containing protein [Plasmodiophora brassicae]|uniref:Protein kinase domain-containing protein n=1 Tax=Plasmodiophora brassicae TaxID=37360 RepID=A0A3P3YHI2_PLABS|nr:unnamed protein product [Plasmodiophora brassicae]
MEGEDDGDIDMPVPHNAELALLQSEGRALTQRRQYEERLTQICSQDIPSTDSEPWPIRQFTRVLRLDRPPISASQTKNHLLGQFSVMQHNAGLVYDQYHLPTRQLATAIGVDVQRSARLASLSPAIVNVRFEVLEVVDRGTVVVVSEAHMGGDLLTRPLVGSEAVRSACRQMLTTLATLHGAGYACGHVFPSKFLHTTASLPGDAVSLKLNVFGVGKYLTLQDQVDLIPDARRFLAPDLHRAPSSRRFRPEDDLYSFGAIVFLLLTGKYYEHEVKAVDEIPDEAARAFLTPLLQHRAESRGSAHSALQAKWLSGDPAADDGIDWDAVQQRLSRVNALRRLEQRVLRRVLVRYGRESALRCLAGRVSRPACLFHKDVKPIDEYVNAAVGEALRQGLTRLSKAYVDAGSRPLDNPVLLLANFLRDARQ